jgi:hypothetical protein
MGTLITGTLERTVGWFHPGAFRRSGHAEALPLPQNAVARPSPPPLLRLQQWLCAARRGHDFILGIDRRRMYLICQSCFHETPGWDLGVRAPRRRY